jgi:hypothetical protein
MKIVNSVVIKQELAHIKLTGSHACHMSVSVKECS